MPKNDKCELHNRAQRDTWPRDCGRSCHSKEFHGISDSCTDHNSMGQQTEVEVCSLLRHQECFCWESCSVSKHLKFSICKAEILHNHPPPAYYLSIRLKKTTQQRVPDDIEP